MTLYGASTSDLMCSSETKAPCRVGTCYSSSWMSYSIKGCRSPTLSSAASSLPSSSATNQARDRHPQRDGVIAGSLVAAVSGAALIFTGVIVLARGRTKGQVKPAKAHELSNESGLAEILSVERQHPREIWADHVAVEIGRNSQVEPPIDGTLAKQRATESQVVLPPVIRIHLAD